MSRYEIELTLIRDQLGTNPCNPHVLDTHIIQKQRKMIMEKSGVNKEINKYLDQLPISEEKATKEVDKIIEKLEELIGKEFSEGEKIDLIAGNLKSLKETFKELDLTGLTVFYRDAETNLPCIGDHMIYGFMKAASEALSRARPKKNATMLQSHSYTSSIINQHVRCADEFINFDVDVCRTENETINHLQRPLRGMTPQGPRVTLAKSEVVPAGAKLKFVLNVLEGSPLKEKHLNEIFSYGVFTGLGQWRNSGCGMFNYTLKKI